MLSFAFCPLRSRPVSFSTNRRSVSCMAGGDWQHGTCGVEWVSLASQPDFLPIPQAPVSLRFFYSIIHEENVSPPIRSRMLCGYLCMRPGSRGGGTISRVGLGVRARGMK